MNLYTDEQESALPALADDMTAHLLPAWRFLFFLQFLEMIHISGINFRDKIIRINWISRSIVL